MNIKRSKFCNQCKKNRHLSSFCKKRNGLNSACKMCKKAYWKKYYSNPKNKKNHVKKAVARNKILQKENHIKIYNYLLNNPCKDCKEKDPLVLEFDHRNNKKLDVSQMYLHAWETIKKEIEKCDVRCANCHSRKTAKQFNHFRYRIQKGLIKAGVV